MSVSVLFHVNHLWGVGHFTRIAAIANAVVACGGRASVIAGNTPVTGRLDADVRLVALPAVRTPDASYARLVDVEGKAPDEKLWARRRELIDTALEDTAPDIVVTETFPFGRRKLSPELLRMIGTAKQRGAAIVASIRDLPTPPSDARRLEECAQRLRDHYDAVLVHGDPAIVPLQEVWPGDIPAATSMTGYVGTAPASSGAPRQGVIVSAGGGHDAEPVLRAAMAARRHNIAADEPWTFVTGPSAPKELLTLLRSNLPASDMILPEAPDLPARIAAARLSISRGGYNTVCETVAAGTRSVVVPFAPPGEPEQARRAAFFETEGLLTHLPEAQLTPDALSAAIGVALWGPAPAPEMLNLNGAAASATRLAEIAAAR